MQLPEVFEAGSLMNGLPVFWRTTFSLAVIHQGDPRMDRVHQLRRTRPMVVFTNVESVDWIIYAIFSRFNEDWKNHTLNRFTQAA